MNKELFLLPFDHRKSFFRDIMDVKGKIAQNHIDQASELKDIIFEGFEDAAKGFKNKKDLGILVDEYLGGAVIKKAKKEKITLCLPVEKSGEDLFDFEFGKNFGAHIKKIKPDFVKVLVRYNPDNESANQKQLERLARLNDFCKKEKYPLILELLVPAAKNDLQICKTVPMYDKKLRPRKTEQAIRELSEKIKPDIWKLEGFAKKDWPAIIAATGENSRIIVLGRGQDQARVEAWLRDAATFKQVIGFAIGRTVFAEPLAHYFKGDLSRREAALYIALKFSYFINFWLTLKK
ncbi:MAG: DUF2090 domain-containing protein [Candidatus Paceibacterota bacterium]